MLPSGSIIDGTSRLLFSFLLLLLLLLLLLCSEKDNFMKQLTNLLPKTLDKGVMSLIHSIRPEKYITRRIFENFKFLLVDDHIANDKQSSIE